VDAAACARPLDDQRDRTGLRAPFGAELVAAADEVTLEDADLLTVIEIFGLHSCLDLVLSSSNYAGERELLRWRVQRLRHAGAAAPKLH
jgi:hypothetical protein